MRTVEFRRTFDDLVAFALFARERLGVNRRQKLYAAAFAVPLFAAVAVWRYRSTGEPTVLAVYAVGLVVYLVAWSRWLGPLVARSCTRRGLRLIYRDGATTTHRLTITDAGVQEVGSEGDNFVSWTGIPEVARTERHLFVFIGPAAAHVVPVAAFASSADADAFFEELQRRKR